MQTIDGWTVVHVFSGALLAAFGFNRVLAYGLIIGTEVVEGILRERGVSFFAETRENVALDLFAGIASYEVVRGIR